MIKFLIPFFFQTNLSSAFPLVSLVVFVCPYSYSLTRQTFSQSHEVCLPWLFSASTRLSLLLSRYTSILCLYRCNIFFDNSSMFPINHPLGSDVIYFFIPSRIPHLYLRLHLLDHCKFILVARVLTPGLRQTHLIWHPPPRHRSCRLPLTFPLPFGKVLVPLVTPILFIIS